MTNTPRPDIRVSRANGDVAVREVMRLVFYLDKPHLRVASRVREAILGFVGLVSVGAFAYHFDNEGNPEPFSADVLSQTINDWFAGVYSSWPNATIEFVGEGGTAPEYSLSYHGKVLGESDYPEETAYLDLWMPRQGFMQKRSSVEAYFRTTAQRTAACAGYMSLAFVGDDKSSRQALAARYSGADIADPLAVSIDLDTRCPGVYWTTFLGPEVLSAVGGADSIRRAVQGDIAIEVLEGGGAMVRLTDDPELGDRNRQQRLDTHESFARFLDARGRLHVPRAAVYFTDRQGFAALDAQEAWHRRFL